MNGVRSARQRVLDETAAGLLQVAHQLLVAHVWAQGDAGSEPSCPHGSVGAYGVYGEDEAPEEAVGEALAEPEGLGEGDVLGASFAGS